MCLISSWGHYLGVMQMGVRNDGCWENKDEDVDSEVLDKESEPTWPHLADLEQAAIC